MPKTLFVYSALIVAAFAKPNTRVQKVESFESQQINALRESVASTIAKLPSAPYMVVAVINSDTQYLQIELRDANGNPMTGFHEVTAWLSDSDTDPALTSTAADGFSINVGTSIEESPADKRITAITDANGVVQLQIDLIGSTYTWYPWISVAGNVYVGPVILYP